MTLIERVARAMFHAECEPHKAVTGYGDTFGWDDAMPAVRDRLMASARAAIGAMREPTDLMIKAAEDGDDQGSSIYGDPFTPLPHDEAWKAMIDAALQES